MSQLQRPFVHVPFLQSALPPHGVPVAHVGVHEGGWHTLPVQMRDPQSAPE